MEYNSSMHHSNVDSGESPVTTLPTPDKPTPYNPSGWGQRCDMSMIKHTRVPSLGPDTWRPMPHETFVGMIEQAFDRHGFTISEPLHYRAKSVSNAKIKDLGEYGRFNTSYGIAHPLLPIIDGVKWESGWLNAYDMTVALQGSLEKRTLICGNGLTVDHSMANFKRKHTSGIDQNREGLFEHIYDLVNNTVGSLVTIAQDEANRQDRYKQTACDDRDARWIIMEAAKKNVIGAAATMKVLEHFERPEHPEFKDGSVMCLEQAFTSDGRGRNIFTQKDRNKKLRNIIDTRFGFDNEVNTEELATNF